MKMKYFKSSMVLLLCLLSNKVNAFEATCDFHSRTERNADGTTRLLLPGGCGTYGSYSWVAIEASTQGDVTISEGVEAEWLSPTSITLTTKNRSCSQQKTISCRIVFDETSSENN
ncbi:MAG: hypothetical protein EOP06_15005 [Proteobacteria bacterium]|nr:MAG: hypothetical protein EOP06_15005 [Pseudomonadota bacterium]